MKVLSYNSSSQHWLFKYKLYHIPFWCFYHYIWWTVGMGNPLKAADSIFFSVFAAKYTFYVVFQAAAVYFNLYFLMPRFLEKSRFTAYITTLLLTIVCSALLIVPGYYLAAFLSGRTITEVYGKDACFVGFFGSALPSTVASMTLGMSIKLTKNWVQTKRRQQLLEKEKLETELKFLKYQFNPHFLFNTINSIFFLIHKNPDMASASLAKFSELLRYQLYECNDVQIPLSKEIDYLENFIELEKLRRNDNIKVDFQMTHSHNGHWGIAPFILMTFVENAFKHVSTDPDKQHWINIHLELDQQQLYFVIANSTAADEQDHVVSYGGIGLPNVQRRLDLIYSGLYELDIQKNNNSFEVRLQLMLSELVMSPSLQVTA